jgi:hypothetical protein
VGVGAGHGKALLFVVAMLAGMALFEAMERLRRQRAAAPRAS